MARRLYFDSSSDDDTDSAVAVEQTDDQVLENFRKFLFETDGKSKSTVATYVQMARRFARFIRLTDKNFKLNVLEKQHLDGTQSIPFSIDFAKSLGETGDIEKLGYSAYIAMCRFAMYRLQQEKPKVVDKVFYR